MQVTFYVVKSIFKGYLYPMPEQNAPTADEKVLKTTPRIHERIKQISDQTNGATMRSTTDMIMEWALPSFESGRVKLAVVESDAVFESE